MAEPQSARMSMAMEMSPLPLGIQSFSKIRTEGLRYVDKTGFAERLVNGGSRYFLSRPRRFGKSLFVDMLKELFEGNEKLFRGLAIHKEWDWNTRYPVIHLRFGGGDYDEEGGVKQRTSELLHRIENEENLPPSSATLGGRFGDLIYGIKKKTGMPVVVLVDEYDKPILDAVLTPEIARKNRRVLQSFYSVLKDEDTNVKFCFVTGVSRFSHVSLFSGANHLRDITLEPEYSSICGYTEADLDAVFSKEIADLDREKIRDWYNGYCWRGEEKVYSPHGILTLLSKQEYDSWWYDSSTPTFLIDVMKQRSALPITLENMEMTNSETLASEVEDVSVAALLFQAGYMTIVGEEKYANTTTYRLDYPNSEVRSALNQSLLRSMLPQTTKAFNEKRANLVTVLENGETDELEEVLHSMFAGIPHQWHIATGAASNESYFASVVYAYFVGWGLDVRVEDSTSKGRVDLVVVMQDSIYLFEFKVVDGEPSGKAMRQIHDKEYADKYRRCGKQIHLIGIEFGKETKNVVDFSAERA